MTKLQAMNALRAKWPEAKYVPADDAECEDDMIQLDNAWHIQVGPGYACLVEEIPNTTTFKYHHTGTLGSAVAAALAV